MPAIERLRITIQNAYLLAVTARIADALFFYILFSKLSTEIVGFYSWVMAIAAFVGAVVDFGLAQVLVREFSQHSITLSRATHIVLRVRGAIVLAGIISWLIWSLIATPSTEELFAVALAGLLQLLIVTEVSVQAWLRANRKQTLANVLGTLDSVFRLMAIATLTAMLDKVHILQILLSIVVLHVAILSVHIFAIVPGNMRIATQTQERMEALSAKAMFLSGGAFTLITLLTVTQNRADWLLLSYYANATDIANYALANKIYELILMALGIAVLTAYPWMCANHKSPQMKVQICIIFSVVLAAGVAMSMGAALYLPDLVASLWAAKYGPAYRLIQLLLPVAALSTFIMIRYYQLIAQGQERTLLKIALISSGLQLIVNLILIPAWGCLGCVAGMAVLAFSNTAFYSALAIQQGIISTQKLSNELAFIGAMYGLTVALWATGSGMIFGVICLVGGATLGGSVFLLTARERTWLFAYLAKLATRVPLGLSA
jgi:O-antigen/teichoic acid export membrane protein